MTVLPSKCDRCEERAIIATHDSTTPFALADTVALCPEHLRELVEEDLEDDGGDPSRLTA